MGFWFEFDPANKILLGRFVGRLPMNRWQSITRQFEGIRQRPMPLRAPANSEPRGPQRMVDASAFVGTNPERSQLLYCPSLRRNLSDCQWQTSQNRTSGPLRRTAAKCRASAPNWQNNFRVTDSWRVTGESEFSTKLRPQQLTYTIAVSCFWLGMVIHRFCDPSVCPAGSNPIRK